MPGLRAEQRGVLSWRISAAGGGGEGSVSSEMEPRPPTQTMRIACRCPEHWGKHTPSTSPGESAASVWLSGPRFLPGREHLGLFAVPGAVLCSPRVAFDLGCAMATAGLCPGARQGQSWAWPSVRPRAPCPSGRTLRVPGWQFSARRTWAPAQHPLVLRTVTGAMLPLHCSAPRSSPRHAIKAQIGSPKGPGSFCFVLSHVTSLEQKAAELSHSNVTQDDSQSYPGRRGRSSQTPAGADPSQIPRPWAGGPLGPSLSPLL